MPALNRKRFLQWTGASVLALATRTAFGKKQDPGSQSPAGLSKRVFLINDGLHLTAPEYLETLQSIKTFVPERDVYGAGGTTGALCRKLAALTGKEDALYLPTGTMTNQLALQLLRKEATTPVYALRSSHVYQDERGAAEVYGNHIVPVDGPEHNLTIPALEAARNGRPGGVVALELPVRRALHRVAPLSDLQALSNWCRERNMPLHLDGARLPVAAAWTGISPDRYAALADTVYISLFKCLGASGGAVLCGSRPVIEAARIRLKPYGGSVFSSFPETAMALFQLDGLQERLEASRAKAEALFPQLNALGNDLHIRAVTDGTNMFEVALSNRIDRERLIAALIQQHDIRPGDLQTLKVNETLLRRSDEALVAAFRAALSQARR